MKVFPFVLQLLYSACHSVICYLVLQSFWYRNICRVSTLCSNRGGSGISPPQAQQAPQIPGALQPLHKEDLDWVPRLGWVRGFTLLTYGVTLQDADNCISVLSWDTEVLFQTPSLPFQGLKAAAIVGAGPQRKEHRSLGSGEVGVWAVENREKPSWGGSHPHQGFQFREAAPLSCQTSLTKHKFKQKTKDFKSRKSGYWTPTKLWSQALEASTESCKAQGLCSRLQDAH